MHAERARAGLLADVTQGRLEAALLLDSGRDLGGLGFPAPAEPLAFLDLDPVPLTLVAAPGHRLAARTALTSVDLLDERLLGPVGPVGHRRTYPSTAAPPGQP